MPDKNKDDKQNIEQALENMETWSYGINLVDTPHGWFSNNWVMSSPATDHTQAGSHHITWQNPPQNTQIQKKNPEK